MATAQDAQDADDLALRCCVCGTSAEDDSNYLNTKMKMLISKCGHRFCDHCIKREFQHHREIPCPACQKLVKKSQLQDKTIEELNYAKETSMRKKVTKDYNKTEDDFNTTDEYNDYLEMLENLIFDLVYGDDTEKAAAQRQWKQYRLENAIAIATNDAKKADEERRIAQLINEQQRVAEERRLLQQREDSQFEADLERQKAQLMEVALGERDESDVAKLRATTTAIPIDQAVTAEMEAAMMGFQPGVIGGPQPVPVPGGKRGPAFGVNESKKLRREQQRAGGYDPDMHYKRNRSEAWCGIYFRPTLSDSNGNRNGGGGAQPMDRLQVLKRLGYISDDGVVQVKGRVACEINTCEEIVLTEVIFENVLATLEPEEIVAVLSALIFQEKTQSEPTLTPRLDEARDVVKRITESLGLIQLEQHLDVDPAVYCKGALNFGLMEVVYEWSRGMPFKELCLLTDVQEGSIVRCITRLDEVCREVRNAARVIGDPQLYRKMEVASESIKRDVVFASSLYLT